MLHLATSEVMATLLLIIMISVTFLFHERNKTSVAHLLSLFSWCVGLRFVATGFKCDLVGKTATIEEYDGQRRVALVTGADGCLGYEVCRGLIKSGVAVIVSCRTDEECASTVERLQRDVPRESVIPPSLSEEKGVRSDDDGEGTFSPTTKNEQAPPRPPRVLSFGGCDMTNIASIGAYVNRVREGLKELGVELGTAVLTAGVIRRSLHYIHFQAGNSNSSGDNNDGADHQPPDTAKSAADRETMFATNSLGPHYLAHLLYPVLMNTARHREKPSRLIFVASSCHRHLGFFNVYPSPSRMLNELHPKPSANSIHAKIRGSKVSKTVTARSLFYPDFVKMYGLTKLMNIYTCQDMVQQQESAARRSKAPISAMTGKPIDPKVIVTACHPGLFLSGLYSDVVPSAGLRYLLSKLSLLVFKSSANAAQTPLFLALEPTRRLVNGGYYYEGREYGATSPVLNSLSRAATNEQERNKCISFMNQSISAAGGTIPGQ